MSRKKSDIFPIDEKATFFLANTYPLLMLLMVLLSNMMSHTQKCKQLCIKILRKKRFLLFHSFWPYNRFLIGLLLFTKVKKILHFSMNVLQFFSIRKMSFLTFLWKFCQIEKKSMTLATLNSMNFSSSSKSFSIFIKRETLFWPFGPENIAVVVTCCV